MLASRMVLSEYEALVSSKLGFYMQACGLLGTTAGLEVGLTDMPDRNQVMHVLDAGELNRLVLARSRALLEGASDWP